jgi:hypothetical protein
MKKPPRISNHMTAGRLQRKWLKLCRDPARFFADAGSPIIREGGLRSLVIGHMLRELPVSLLRTLDILRCWGRTGDYTLTPLNQLNREGDVWVSTGEDPQFNVSSRSGMLPRGWTLVSVEFADLGEWLEPVIYVDDGRGFSEKTAIRLLASRAGSITRLVRLPDRVKALRMDPMARPGQIKVTQFSMQPMSSLAALRHALGEADNDLATALSFCMRSAQACDTETGISREEYAKWIEARDTLTDKDRGDIRAAIKGKCLMNWRRMTAASRSGTGKPTAALWWPAMTRWRWQTVNGSWVSTTMTAWPSRPCTSWPGPLTGIRRRPSCIPIMTT